MTTSRTQEIGDESRTRILDAAEELFAKQGFIETSMADVAELSGISRGSIPWHFTNKAGLLMAVVERATHRAAGPPFPPGLAESETTLAAIGQAFKEPHMALLHTLLADASKPGSEISDSYLAYHEQDRARAAAWLASSPELRVDGIDESTLAVLIYALFVGIHVQWRVDPDHIDLDETLASVAPFFRALFAGLPQG